MAGHGGLLRGSFADTREKWSKIALVGIKKDAENKVVNMVAMSEISQ